MIEAVRVSLVYERCPTSYKLMEQDDDYYNLVRSLWKQGERFIICEHDVIPWPGAIAEIDECDNPWCTFWYRSQAGWLGNALGLAKFDPANLPDIFSEPFETTHWRNLDMEIANRLQACSIGVHTHSPAVTNLNPLMTPSLRMKPPVNDHAKKHQSPQDLRCAAA